MSPASKPYISFIGESRKRTVITYDDNVTYMQNAPTQSFEIRGANITLENINAKVGVPEQDTNGVKGVATIDYIYGNGNTYIENSELKHVGMAGGYTTVASTDQNTKHGYETTSL